MADHNDRTEGYTVLSIGPRFKLDKLTHCATIDEAAECVAAANPFEWNDCPSFVLRGNVKVVETKQLLLAIDKARVRQRKANEAEEALQARTSDLAELDRLLALYPERATKKVPCG